MTSNGILEALGWAPARDSEFAPLAAAGFIAGRVSLEHNHILRVLTSEGERLAEIAGTLKHEAESRLNLPVVGDWVGLRAEQAGTRHQIRHILARRSWFSRKSAGRTTTEQVIASNIDTVLIVFGLDDAPNVQAIERYLVVTRRSGAAPVVVLSKSDLTVDLGRDLAATRAVASDAPVIAVSARDHDGLEQLEPYLGAGATVALLGPSGAGKSSIVNALLGEERLPTGAVREWDARGRHTSVHRQLLVRPAGGVIIDTPGLRELQLWETEGVGDTFDDVVALAAGCRFRDCHHDREPDCAVKKAVDAGDLDARRYASFLKLSQEQLEIEQKRNTADHTPRRKR